MKIEIENNTVTLEYNGNGYSGEVDYNERPAHNWDSDYFVSFTLILDDVKFPSGELLDILYTLGDGHLFTRLYNVLDEGDYTNIDIEAFDDSVTLTVGVDKLCSLVLRINDNWDDYDLIEF